MSCLYFDFSDPVQNEIPGKVLQLLVNLTKFFVSLFAVWLIELLIQFQSTSGTSG